MTIWPVILDSRPKCLRGRSLLQMPLGADTILGHLQSTLRAITNKRPIVVSTEGTAEDIGELQAPQCLVVSSRQAFLDATDGCELSDALLLIDPRCSPSDWSEYSRLVGRGAAEPRVAHQLVAFDTGVSGTKEHVNVDAKGQIRGVLRYYEPATWPFIAGVAATLLPVACGVVGEDGVPDSLSALRQLIAARGVPSRDVEIVSSALDLSDEPGLLSASELWIARDIRERNPAKTPLLVGTGHVIHPTSRLIGPVVVHQGARIDQDATIIGPALIGAAAHVEAGATIAHAVLGPGCTLSAGRTMRNCLSFDGEGVATDEREARPSSYRDRLNRLTIELRDEQTRNPVPSPPLMKRAIDATVAAVALALLSPLLIIVTILTWLESGRPIFYAQTREGLGGRVFRCWKFRTMIVGADSTQRDLKGLDAMDGPHFKLERDPRVTRLGRLLRAANIDELPQLFNVLVGDMSLVGPRPSPFRENQICVPWREARLSVRPGITGMWQVCRHDRAAGDFHQWIEYDMLYVQHMSLWLDLKIAAATIVTLGGKTPVAADWLVRRRHSSPLPDADVRERSPKSVAAERVA